MGVEIPYQDFGEADHARFAERLRSSLAALEQLLSREGFGVGPETIGAELELDLVDENARPALVNQAVLRHTADPRVTLEVDQFNLEINSKPEPLVGRPFTALAAELGSVLAEVQRAAATQDARAIAIGILPTLVESDLTPAALTPGNRYIALSRGIRRIRRELFRMHIVGEDVLKVSADDVVFEGANTSLQLHLRTSPADFAHLYNAAQIASGVALAPGANCTVNVRYVPGRAAPASAHLRVAGTGIPTSPTNGPNFPAN